MTAAVETMAYRNEVPWHGLGEYIADAVSVPEMARIARVDWPVEKVEMTTADGRPVPGFFALVRGTDRRVLDVVGSRYVPIQNLEAFEFFTEFVEAGDATMETMGSLRGGRYVWGLANLDSGFHVDGKKDRVNGYLLVGVPHEQGKSLIIRTTHVRVVCQNTLTMALRESMPEFRMAHRREFDQKMIDNAREVLGLARGQVAEFKETAQSLKRLTLDLEDVLKIVVPIMSPKTTDDQLAAMIGDGPDAYTPRIASIMGAYHDAPGADPGTAWGALNAVTYYADHMASNSDDARLANAWFGKTARQKTRVMNELLELVA